MMSQAVYVQGEKEQAIIPVPVNLNQNNDVAQVNVVSFQQQHFGGKRFSNKKKVFHCTLCNNMGHTIVRCYKKHGYPPHNNFMGVETLEVKEELIIPCLMQGILLL